MVVNTHVGVGLAFFYFGLFFRLISVKTTFFVDNTKKIAKMFGYLK